MVDLDEATRDLYAAFRGYPLKPKLDSCPHCQLDAAEAQLHVVPLEAMTWEDFGVYPAKAITTFGDVEDFKHFLPRMLELHAIDPAGAPREVDLVFSRLDYGKWTSWPEVEIRAVRAFVRAWLHLLETRPSQVENEFDGDWELDGLRSALIDTGFELDRPS